MRPAARRGLRAAGVWAALVLAIAVPLAAAGASPLLAWRQPVYIVAGFAGIAAMGLLLLQPLLAAGALPGLRHRLGRRAHRWSGAALVTLVLLHVGGLWLTSPPDVVDALLFRSPTPFSVWGVIAMWALLVTALMALRRGRSRGWHLWHRGLVLVVVAGSVVHALLVEGTMEPWSRAALCVLALVASLTAVLRLRIRAARPRPS